MNPDLVMNEPTATGWLRTELFGNKDRAKDYIHAARTVLGTMRAIYGVNERIAMGQPGGFYHQWQEMADGTWIHAVTNDGHDTIRIVAPPPPISVASPKEGQTVIEEFDSVLVCGYIERDIPDVFDATTLFTWGPGADVLRVMTLPGQVIGASAPVMIANNSKRIVSGYYDDNGDWTLTWLGENVATIPADQATIMRAPSGISADGRTIVGTGFGDPYGSTLWKWSEADGLTLMGPAWQSTAGIQQASISPNGRWIATATADNTGLLYDSDGTTHPISGWPFNVADDGTVVGNNGGSLQGPLFLGGRAFIQAPGGEPEFIGDGSAYGISADGSMVVGSREDTETTVYVDGFAINYTPKIAWYWTRATGVIDLGEGVARNVSDNKRVIVGWQTSTPHLDVTQPSVGGLGPDSNIPIYNNDGDVVALIPVTFLNVPVLYDDYVKTADRVPVVLQSDGYVYGTVPQSDFPSYTVIFVVDTVGDPSVVATYTTSAVVWSEGIATVLPTAAQQASSRAWDVATPRMRKTTKPDGSVTLEFI